MYVCMCNPFTDKDVKTALENPSVPNTTAHVYKACSGGNGPNCGSCINAIKCMVVDHQSNLGVQKLKETLPEFSGEEFAEEEFASAE